MHHHISIPNLLLFQLSAHTVTLFDPHLKHRIVCICLLLPWVLQAHSPQYLLISSPCEGRGAAFLNALIAYARLPWELCARAAYLLVVTRQPDGSTRLQGSRMADNDMLCEDFTPLPAGADVFCNLFYAAWQVLKKRTCTKDST